MNMAIKHKKIIVIFLIILSIIFGIFIFNKLSDNTLKFIINNANNLNYMTLKTILFHIILLSLSFLLSFAGIGIIFLLIYLFFEGVVVGFMTTYFISLYKMQGIVYSIVYIAIYKILIIFLIIILSFKCLKIFSITIKYLKKEKADLTKTIINSVIIIIIILVYDVILLLFGENILNIF